MGELAIEAKAIRKQVNKLCERTRADAVALVDAFGIPDALLAAPSAYVLSVSRAVGAGERGTR